MRTKYSLALLLIFAFAITACSSASTQSGQNSTDTTGQGQRFNNRPISPQMQLAVGIFKLEGTPQAVDAKEAAKLIPLWQLFGQLEASSSSAQEEVSATVDQIKSTMSTDQINTINTMNLTNRDAFTFLQEQGIIQAGGFGFRGTPDPNRTPRPGGGGGFPGGGFSGGRDGNGTNLKPNQTATMPARRAQGGGFSNRLPSGLLDALIKLLQSKITPESTSTPVVTSTNAPVVMSTGTPAATSTP